MTTALVTGITGQDGGYLAEQLVADGLSVIGLKEMGVEVPPWVPRAVDLVEGSLRDASSLESLVASAQPDQVYNLAAQSSVGDSYDQVVSTCEVTGLGALRLLDACHRLAPGVRFIQASSSEMFGNALESPQTETTPFLPHSPYGIAKLMAHQLVGSYRTSRRMACSTAILFNHEFPRRGPGFVTRKITRAAARISLGMEQSVSLGNLDARRDWGFAGDYMDALRRIVASDTPGDYVVATGITHSIRDVLEIAFERVGLSWQEHVVSDASLTRPRDIAQMCGDSSLLRNRFGWTPRVDFASLITLMVDNDVQLAQAELAAQRRTV